MILYSVPPAHSPAFAQTFMNAGDDTTTHRRIDSCSCPACALPERATFAPTRAELRRIEAGRE